MRIMDLSPVLRPRRRRCSRAVGPDEPWELAAQTFAQTIARTLSRLPCTWQEQKAMGFHGVPCTKMPLAPSWGVHSVADERRFGHANVPLSMRCHTRFALCGGRSNGATRDRCISICNRSPRLNIGCICTLTRQFPSVDSAVGPPQRARTAVAGRLVPFFHS